MEVKPLQGSSTKRDLQSKKGSVSGMAKSPSSNND